MQLAALVGIYCLCLGYHRQGWPTTGGCWGLSLSFVTRARVAAYLHLYVPAALSVASDFWRMSAVGAFAARLSTLDLAVFTASYRIMWISLVLSGSITGGVSIAVGQVAACFTSYPNPSLSLALAPTLPLPRPRPLPLTLTLTLPLPLILTLTLTLILTLTLTLTLGLCSGREASL